MRKATGWNPSFLRLDDAQSRRLLLVGAVVAAVVVTAGVVLTWGVQGALQERLAEWYVDAAAVVVAENPEAAPAIVELVQGEADEATLRRGREILEGYGVRPDTIAPERAAGGAGGAGGANGAASLDLGAPASLGSDVPSALVRLRLLLIFTPIVAVCVVLVAAAVALSGVLRRVDDLALLARRIVGGEFRFDPTEETEGSIGRLSHEIRQTAHRLERAAEASRETSEELRRFLSDVSHQIKTPLSSVRMYHDLLLEYEEEPGSARGTRREFLERSLAQLDRTEWLVKNLLTLARLEAGALPIQKENAGLADTIRNAVRPFEAKAEAAGVELVVEPGVDASPHVPHDPRWLAEAVSNVVKNALEHSPGGGRVSLGVEATEVFARVVVKDQGPGIAPEDLPHLFERFYRGSSPRGGSGTGIGLALAKAIVERHGGVISATAGKTGPRGATGTTGTAVPAGAEGTGARFTITLPRAGRARLTNL